MPIRIYGSVTRELYTTWYSKVGSSNQLPVQCVQKLFNELELFPSKSQVYEMLHCARECSDRNMAAYLTFGEFCIFVTELKKCYDREVPKPVQLSKLPEKNGHIKKRNERKMSKNSSKYEVFLGGSCNPTTWRQDIAIPMLKSLGITYYNPQVAHWGPELIELENQAKQNASVLFFVIDNQTRSVASIIEAANISGCQRKLILVVHEYKGPQQEILGEPISDQEFEDLTNSQMILQDLVERQGIPVFNNIAVALNCTAKILRENLSVQDLGLKDFVQPVKMTHVQLGDKLIKLHEAFDALDTSNAGELSLADVCMAFRILTNRDLSLEDLKDIVVGHKGQTEAGALDDRLEEIQVSFDQFCCIVSEFREQKLENRRLWEIFLAKTYSFVQAFLTPLTKAIEWALTPRPMRAFHLQITNSNGRGSCVRDIYLGGSCGSTSWREDTAIPMLKKSGLTYFSPQVSHWSKRLIPIEAAAMDNCRALLFVITSSTRSLSSMAVAAHYIGLGCNVVLCVQHLPQDCVIGREKISKQAVQDYNRGRMYLSDLANREGLPVFDDITEAVECIIQRCKSR